MMKKRLTARMLIVTFVIALISGCGLQREDRLIIDEDAAVKNDGVEITFYGYKADSPDLTAIETALHGFMDENPDVNVSYEGVKGKEYWEAFEKRVNANVLDDVAMTDHDRVQMLTEKGMLADLSDLSTVPNFKARVARQFTNADGTVYFLPTCVSTYNLYVNYGMLESHEQKIPENIEEFTAVCDYFVSQGIVPIIANNRTTVRTLVAAKSLYSLYQSDDVAVEIEKINSGETDVAALMRPGMELVDMMLKKGWIDGGEAIVTEAASDDMNRFALGERPFMVTGGWVSARLAEKNPPFSYGLYPFPILEDGSVLVMDVNTCISVNADSPNLEVAKKLVEYLTLPDVTWEYCKSQSCYTPLQDDRLPEDEAISPSAAYFANGRNIVGSDYRLRIQMDSMLEECGKKMLLGMSAADAENYLDMLVHRQTVE